MHPHLHDLDQASWITHPDWADVDPPHRAPVLRWTGTIPATVRSARVTIAGLGIWTARLNGTPTSADVLEPGVSETRVRVAAVSHDITALLRQGTNELVIELGEGPSHVREIEHRYTKFVEQRVSPRAKVAVVLEHADGSTETHRSDARWGALLGPTTLSHWFGGEDYDARLEPENWHGPQITPDAAWRNAVVIAEPATGPEPWARLAPPMRVVDLVEEQRRIPVEGGVTIDLGRNLAGRQVLRLDASFPADARIEMMPSEYVHDDGTADQSSTGKGIVDHYISAGGAATWRPRFCYHGFRYLQVRVTDAAGQPLPADGLHISAEQVMTDDRVVGGFGTADPTLQGIYDLVTRAIESNLYSVPTDCPHREKLGWLEQLDQVFHPVSFRFDVADHYADMITHMIDSQTAEGLIPDIAPELVIFEDGFRDDVNWGSVIWHLPLHLYRQYGDLEPARRAWHSGMRYLEYIESIAGDGLLDHGLSDWITLDDSTPRPLVATFGWVRMLDSAALVATALERAAEAEEFREQATRLRALLEETFVERDGSELTIGSGSQASIALMIDLDVLTGGERDRAAAQLVEALHAERDRLTVGEIGLAALQRVLIEYGHHELLHRVFTRLDAPSYATMLAAGETTLHEHWTGRATHGSANHFMLGYVAHWLSGSVAGLEQAEDSVAWRRARIAPTPLPGVDSARAHHDSPSGHYSTSWWRTAGDRLALQVTVPPAGAARLVMPEGFVATDAQAIREDLGPGTHLIVLAASLDH